MHICISDATVAIKLSSLSLYPFQGSSNAGVSMRQPDSTVYNEASQRCPEYEPLSSSMHRVFRPPITPFSLDLENDDDDLTNLPRLGTSPGPQIPPSSPTEFLPFYSEAASKSAARQKQGQSTVTPPAGEDCCLTTASDGDTSTCSGLDRLDHPRTALSNASLETPPASALMMMHGTHDLHAADNNDLSPSSPGQSDDGSQDRTLTNFESQFDSVLGGRCSMPSGLANVPSPSDSNIIADDLTDKRRLGYSLFIDNQSTLVNKSRVPHNLVYASFLFPGEQLQNELSTPGPAEPSESSPRRPDASTVGPLVFYFFRARM